MRTRFASTLAVTVAALLLAAVPASARTTVSIKDIAFSKGTVKVQPGEVVVWKDMDGYVTHNVTSRGKHRFASSGSLQVGDSHRVRFKQTGQYRYVCTIHPVNMRAKIVVE